MPTITIRVTDEENEFLRYMANFLGKSITEVVKEYTIEELEDIFDVNMADKAFKEWSEEGQEVIGLQDVKKEFGYQMKYKLLFNKKVLKTLKKLDANDRKIIINWLEKNIDNSSDPRQFGKSLKGNLKEYWRYRIGKYRVIVLINDNELCVLTIDAEHRKDIYQSG